MQGFDYASWQKAPRAVWLPHGSEIVSPAPMEMQFIEMPEWMGMSSAEEYEVGLNNRAREIGSNIRYTLLPHGMKIVGGKAQEDGISSHVDKAIVKCAYCRQWAARFTSCKHCGGRVD